MSMPRRCLSIRCVRVPAFPGPVSCAQRSALAMPFHSWPILAVSLAICSVPVLSNSTPIWFIAIQCLCRSHPSQLFQIHSASLASMRGLSNAHSCQLISEPCPASSPLLPSGRCQAMLFHSTAFRIYLRPFHVFSRRLHSALCHIPSRRICVAPCHCNL